MKLVLANAAWTIIGMSALCAAMILQIIISSLIQLGDKVNCRLTIISVL